MRSVNASKVAGAGDAPGPAAAARAPSRRGVERFFTKEKLTLLAGATGYDRGCDYAQHLRVVKLRRWRGRIEATVEGREDYDVRLWDEGYRLGFSCSCPVGQRLQLCKHGVATALTWLRERQAFDRERPARRAVVRLADVRTHLMTLDKAELVERLLDSAQHSGEQLAAMKLDLAWRGPEGPNMPALKHAIRNWMWAGRDMHSSGITPMAVPRVELMAHILRSLLRESRGEDVLALLDCLFRTAPVSSTVCFSYDGDGGYPDLLRAFQELHYEACRKVRPTPDRLARDLLDYEVELDIEVFDGALKRYSGLLGRKGRLSYLAQVEDLARSIRPRDPGGDGYFEPGWDRHHRLFRVVQGLDLGLPPEWYVDVLARNQRWPDAHYIIASRFAAAGRAEEALHWVETGLESGIAPPEPRLLALGVDACRSRGWLDRAARLVLREFERRPNATLFAMLRNVGTEAGHWPSLRRRAFGIAKAAVANCRRGDANGDLDVFGTRRDVSLLVGMYLVEGDAKAAQRTAGKGYCRDHVWISLADALGETKPQEAAELYELRLRQLLMDLGRRDVLQECDELIRKLRGCREKAGQAERFRDWVENARMAYRESTAFCALLDRCGTE